MGEKRFYLLSYKNYPIYDSVEDKEYNARFRKQREKLCDLLNEWVAKCNQLEEENEQLKREVKEKKDFLINFCKYMHIDNSSTKFFIEEFLEELCGD